MRRGILICIVLALQLAGCTVWQPKAPPPKALAKPQALEREGDFVAAAQEYVRLAAQARAPLRDDYRLRAASAWLRAGETNAATQLLNQIHRSRLSAESLAQETLVRAELALLEGDAAKSLQLTKGIRETALPRELRAQKLRLKANALAELGRPLAAVEQRVRLDPLLSLPQDRRTNRDAIWKTLSGLSNRTLLEARQQPPPDTLSGWLELAYLVKFYRRTPEQLSQQLDAWQERYPGHPANERLASLRGAETAISAYPGQIAVLLPLSGKVGHAAAVLRDGFLAAYYFDTITPNRPVIRFYDVGAPGASIDAIYRQAVSEGADFVVGPLTKQRVGELVQNTPLERPTLVLNYPTQPVTQDNVFQFGLSPEDEARQIAERAWLAGYVRALALYPKGDWGQRVVTAFEERWQEIGGVIAARASYGTDPRDYANTVRQLLGSGASEEHHPPLTRRDADFLMLVAFPQQARQLRSFLSLYHAQDLPVYATSHIYSGHPNYTADQAMEGIVFCDLPWVLADEVMHRPESLAIAELWRETYYQHRRLYALGVDAYRIIPHLQRLAADPFARFAGVTGSLRLDDQHRVHRELLWARFVRGRPELIPVESVPVP